MSEYPKVENTGDEWFVRWSVDDPCSWMPDEATARRCAASAKLLEFAEELSETRFTIPPWIRKGAEDAISAATAKGGE